MFFASCLRHRLSSEIPVVSYSEGDERSQDDPQAGQVYIVGQRVAEDPPETGIWKIGVTVVAEDVTIEAIDAIETLAATSTVLSCLFSEGADDRENGFVVPKGQCAAIDAPATRSGVGQAQEYRWGFSVWCQAREISDAALA